MAEQLAYIVLVHKAPAQAEKMLRALATDRTAFYVHVDRGVAPAVADEFRTRLTGIPHVRFVSRRRTAWGSFGLVAATLDAIEAIEEDGLRCSHAVLLSGQDFPIVPPAQIETHFAAHPGVSFIECHDMPYWGDSHLRLRHWHLHLRGTTLSIPARRAEPRAVAPIRGGSMWWALAREDLVHVLDVTRRHPEVVRYFRHTLIPDEVYFQTLVRSRPDAQVISDDLHFIHWPDDAHPLMLGADDIDDMAASSKLYARKFDETANPGILELLSERLLR